MSVPVNDNPTVAVAYITPPEPAPYRPEGGLRDSIRQAALDMIRRSGEQLAEMDAEDGAQ